MHFRSVKNFQELAEQLAVGTFVKQLYEYNTKRQEDINLIITKSQRNNSSTCLPLFSFFENFFNFENLQNREFLFHFICLLRF
jgi:hypothetical protein